LLAPAWGPVFCLERKISYVKITAEDIEFWFAGLAILAIGGVVAFRYFSVR
jgi:hypothetical protein